MNTVHFAFCHDEELCRLAIYATADKFPCTCGIRVRLGVHRGDTLFCGVIDVCTPDDEATAFEAYQFADGFIAGYRMREKELACV